MEVVLEAGADDLGNDGEHFEVSTTQEVFHDVQQALEQAGIVPSDVSIVMEPQNSVQLAGKKAQQCLTLLEVLEDHDDVQKVYANLEVDNRELDSGVA